MLALTISLEEEDGRIHGDLVEGLKETFRQSLSNAVEMSLNCVLTHASIMVTTCAFSAVIDEL